MKLSHLLLLPLTVAASALSGNDVVRIFPSGASASVDKDADDPAIWVNKANPANSRIIGTCKGGGLYVYDLQGGLVQAIRGLDRPNNVDIDRLGNADIAVMTERGAKRLRVFAIDPQSGKLSDITGKTAMFAGQLKEAGAPMGVALYRRPNDGALYAFVSRKEGPKKGCLWQYRLQRDAAGKVNATKVRELGQSTGNEIESLVADDDLGYLYCSEESVGVHKYYADPAASPERLALFATTGFIKDREGLGIYKAKNGKGYIVVSDQGDGESQIHLYPREGSARSPHDHSQLVAELTGGADTTDGLEVVSADLPGYPAGLLVSMNSMGRNFLYYDWRDVKSAIQKR